MQAILSEALQSGADPVASDAFLINGQPGDLYPCSSSGNLFYINIVIESNLI